MNPLRTRERYQQEEDDRLSALAVRSTTSRGRVVQEPEHPYRTVFQRDRDRVIHSRAFRRLEYKTQVFVHHEGDHYRNRLTHTLEASQITRTISRILRLNEDLAEAIVLAHDLGHTPFGHAGEHALDRLLEQDGASTTTARACASSTCWRSATRPFEASTSATRPGRGSSSMAAIGSIRSRSRRCRRSRPSRPRSRTAPMRSPT